MTQLADYGSPLFTYTGSGTVYYEGGLTRAVAFEAGQTREGTAWVLTTAANASLAETMASAFSPSKPLRFEGERSAGDRLRTSGPLIAQAYLPETNEPGLYEAFRARELRFERAQSGIVREYRCGLSNAAIWGVEETEYITDGIRTQCSGIQFRLPTATGGAVAATLVQAKDAEKRVRRVRVLREIDVLSELIVPFEGGLDARDIEQGVNDVCYVLSVARGTKVNWPYLEERDAEGSLIARVHRSVVTKAYSPCAPVDDRPELAGATQALLTDSLATYRVRREALRLDRGVIDTYLDAKLETDYLEPRGLKMVVAIEMLKSAFLGSPEASALEYILPKERFAELVPEPQAVGRPVLTKAGVVKDECAAIGGVRKLGSLNRRSFGNVLRKLLRSLEFKPAPGELELFLASRNKLVHEGRFYAVAATPEDRAELEALAGETAEYFFLVSFVDRLLLSVLGYRGQYADMRDFTVGGGLRDL